MHSLGHYIDISSFHYFIRFVIYEYSCIHSMLLFFGLLFGREVLRQKLYDFFMIALLGNIERR